MSNQKQIVIIGAGFGGMHLAKKLIKANTHITLIDRRNYHLFQPLLYQVATAGLAPDEIAYPLRAIFRGQKNLDFLLADVQRVDLDARMVLTDRGPRPYDILVIAVGAQVNYFGNESLRQNAWVLKDIGDAVALRNHILNMFEKAVHETDPDLRRSNLSFIVVGGGPTGVESAGAISELIRLVLRKDYPSIDLNDVQVILLEAAKSLLNGFPVELQKKAQQELVNKHVDVRLSIRVASYDGCLVTLANGEILHAGTLLWSAGVRASSLVDNLGLPQAPMSRIKVTPELNIEGHEEVYVIGDAAYLEVDGVTLPMMAPVAVQQADLVAENILADEKGESQRDFVYKDPGSLATIGRNSAVARIGRWQFSGFTAWVVWLVVHLSGLIGFRNRLIVLINWAWDYFFYDRAVRLIIKE